MRSIWLKITFIALSIIALLFFTNDFELINIEKNAIVTAIGIDEMPDGKYEISAQIAVPEATDTNTENKKSVITGTGSTVGAAIKSTGNISGWFPKLAFCNLIIIGREIANENVIKVLDYFSKTLRVQDSALIVMAEKTAKELLTVTSPLDNISSFAIQKILLKDSGFDQDVIPNDVRHFCSGYFSPDGSSTMPLIKLVSRTEDSSSGGQEGGSKQESAGQAQATTSQSPQNAGQKLFDASTTALFKNGIFIDSIDKELTKTYNLITTGSNSTTFEINDINNDNTNRNYLLTVINCKPKVSVTATLNDVFCDISLKIYVKISDQNTADSHTIITDNSSLPLSLKEKAENYFYKNVNNLLEKSINSECDILKLKEKLYRYQFDQYSRYKDNILSVAKFNVAISVDAQK